MKQGFTLIELLVTVLIIGVLAAIALPQYQKAVWKSRLVQAKITARALADAQERYFLANGTWTNEYADLDIDVGTASATPGYLDTPWGGQCRLGRISDRAAECLIYKGNSYYLAYRIFSPHSTYGRADGRDFAGKAVCFAFDTPGSLAYRLCQAETGQTSPTPQWGPTYFGFIYP